MLYFLAMHEQCSLIEIGRVYKAPTSTSGKGYALFKKLVCMLPITKMQEIPGLSWGIYMYIFKQTPYR